jgi:hypothetical protein
MSRSIRVYRANFSPPWAVQYVHRDYVQWDYIYGD